MKSNLSFESSMTKAQMRILRAKVKQLLSLDPCRCTVTRGDRVGQLELKKRVFKTIDNKKPKRWNAPKILENQFYTQQIIENEKPEFNKLSKQQLIQISQFKQYYLGDKNIQFYEQFMQSKDNSIYSSKNNSLHSLQHRKNKSQHQFHRSPKFPSNYRRVNFNEYIMKQQYKRQQARSNYSSICQKEQRKHNNLIQKSDSKIILANRTRQNIISRYIEKLQKSDSKFRIQRDKIKEKRMKEVENSEIDDMTHKLKRICCFRPTFNRYKKE